MDIVTIRRTEPQPSRPDCLVGPNGELVELESLSARVARLEAEVAALRAARVGCVPITGPIAIAYVVTPEVGG